MTLKHAIRKAGLQRDRNAPFDLKIFYFGEKEIVKVCEDEEAIFLADKDMMLVPFEEFSPLRFLPRIAELPLDGGSDWLPRADAMWSEFCKCEGISSNCIVRVEVPSDRAVFLDDGCISKWHQRMLDSGAFVI